MSGDEQIVAVGDATPPIKEQARLSGWEADILNFGKAEQEGVSYFNPGLVRRPDGLWLLVRRSENQAGMTFGKNGIWACKLNEDKTPIGGPKLWFPDSGPDEQFEDPRAVYWNNQTWIGCVNFTWFADGTWTGAHQMLGIFKDDPDWTAIARRDPPVDTNKPQAGFTDGKHQKNWTWFFLQDKLHLLYNSDPWIIVEFGSTWDKQVHHVSEGAKWKLGHIRGGTPPVLVDDLFYTFFHSSTSWRDPFRRYYMGALAFETKPPFKPVKWTQEPLLVGSQNDPWQQKKPLVVFPCGALYENGKWLISYGINDLKCGWVEIPHDDIVRLIQEVPVAPAAQLLSSKTPKFVAQLNGKICNVEPAETGTAPEISNGADVILEKRRSAAAKARAVLAEKRKLGTVKLRKNKRRRRKVLRPIT